MKFYRHNPRSSSRVLKCAVTASARLNFRGDHIFGKGDALADLLSVRRVKCSLITSGGARCLWYIPENAPIDRAIMYLHGDTYAQGGNQMHYCASHLASVTGLRVMAVDHQLSAKNNYLAALEDSMEVYDWLLTHGASGDRLCIVGDSVGGGLALSSAIIARGSGMDLPSSLALISPWLNLSCTGISYRLVHDGILRRDRMLRKAKKYAGKISLRSSVISPLYGDHEGLPPTLLIAGTGELLLSDSVRLAKMMTSEGVDCELHLYNGMFHDMPLIFPQTRDGNDALCLIRSHVWENMRAAQVR